jgi:hypothetical protein
MRWLCNNRGLGKVKGLRRPTSMFSSSSDTWSTSSAEDVGEFALSMIFLGRQHNKQRLGDHQAKHPTDFPFGFNSISVVYPDISAATTLNNGHATVTLISVRNFARR